ncbi:MAG: HDOD domain-containing protein [Fimbriimonas sp.]
MATVAEQNVRLAALLERVDGLAVLPHVVFKVLEISGSAESPAVEMERAIIVDPGFSSKVLVLANSASFGLPKKVVSIREAVMFLGFRTVRNLAMTVGTFDMFVGKNDKESLRRRAWWRHSVDAAVACRYIAKRVRLGEGDEAYTCGLLHLIGKTLLDRSGGKEYDLVVKLVDMGATERQAERAVYGCDHIEVAVGACTKWGLPPSLIAGLRYADHSPPDAADAKIRACTALGTVLAARARSGAEGGELPEWALIALRVTGVDEFSQSTMAAVVEAQLQI